MRRALWMIGLIMVGLLVWVANAQDLITPLTPSDDDNIAITFPPPVYVLRGTVEIRGTADAVNMANYFLEFRPLVVDNPTTDTDESDETRQQRPWFPATLPAVNAIQDAVLGAWNTNTAPDGLYELRLTVNITGNEPQYFRVSPLRIENKPPDFVVLPEITSTPTPALQPPARPTLQPTPTALPGSAPAQPTPRPSPTGLSNDAPRVVAVTNSNVRLGDSVAYPRVGSLQVDESAPILGISSLGTGWYYIQLSDGARGFVAPSVVRTEGNISTLTPVVPPPVPAAPPTFTPFATARPGTTPIVVGTPVPGASNTNLVISGFRLEPVQPRCGETFQIFINVTNTGTVASSTGFTVAIVDRHAASGTTTGSTTATVPPIAPGGNFLAVANLTINTFFEEGHTISAIVDSTNAIAETNEGDNLSGVSYTLATAGC